MGVGLNHTMLQLSDEDADDGHLCGLGQPDTDPELETPSCKRVFSTAWQCQQIPIWSLTARSTTAWQILQIPTLHGRGIRAMEGSHNDESMPVLRDGVLEYHVTWTFSGPGFTGSGISVAVALWY